MTGGSDTSQMMEELETVLSDPVFGRSPVLARLLRYLVEVSTQGRGAILKSYTVAVEGLGKPSDFDPQIDTYARVMIGRLRRALDSYYARNGGERRHRLVIESGTYEVKLEPPTASPAVQPLREQRLPIWPMGIAIASILALLLALLFRLVATHPLVTGDASAWQTSNFPTVSVSTSGIANRRDGNFDESHMREMLLSELSKYPSVRAVSSNSGRTDHRLTVSAYPNGNGVSLTTIVSSGGTDSIIWSHRYSIKSRIDEENVAKEIAFRVAGMTGAINQNALKNRISINTPYGCWLDFAMKSQTNFMTSDSQLNWCAKNWYAATPNRPLAAAVYAWTLVDRSLHAPTEGQRQKLLNEAVEVLDDAKGQFSDSGFLRISAARAYDFSGDINGMKASAQEALQLCPENPDFQGAVGTMLILRNDPAGEALLDRAIAQHLNPPSWYYIGKFVAATMRDDTKAAGQAVESIRESNRSLSLLPFLSSIYKARIGNLPKARESWQEAENRMPLLRFNHDLPFDRMPLSQDVKSRLKQWLEPLLAEA